MRFTAYALGVLGAAALAGPAAAQPTPTGDSPTSCDPSKTNCPPAPTTNTNTDSTNPTGANDQTSPTPDTPVSPPLINPSDVPVPQPPPPEPTYGGAMVPAPAPYQGDNASLAHLGIGLVVGGGVDGFTSSGLRNTTNDGGSWDVRAIVGTRSPLALEAAYIGSAQAVNALGLDSNAVLVGNGAQGDVRLNVGGNIPVQPFVFGGVAWRRYEITNTKTNTSDLVNNDDVLELPAGIGLAIKRYGFMAEARGEVRAAIGENLVPNNSGGNEAMHRWGVNASIGYEF
jgi:hypothetical protein